MQETITGERDCYICLSDTWRVHTVVTTAMATKVCITTHHQLFSLKRGQPLASSVHQRWFFFSLLSRRRRQVLHSAGLLSSSLRAAGIVPKLRQTVLRNTDIYIYIPCVGCIDPAQIKATYWFTLMLWAWVLLWSESAHRLVCFDLMGVNGNRQAKLALL